MEIEAKFQVDHETLARLAELVSVGEWQLEGAAEATVEDRYLDTPARALWHRGYALRMRQKKPVQEITVTLKGLGGAEGAVHRREELETQLESERRFPDWPDSGLAQRVAELIGGEPLEPLLTVHQIRRSRLATRDGRQCAEISLDHVTVEAEGRQHKWNVVEVELLGDGTERDLEEIAEALRGVATLTPDSRSKFHAAQDLLGLTPAGLLTTPQRDMLISLSERSDLHGRRARAILALDRGATQVEAAEGARMSERRVRYWLAEFRKHGLGIFRAQVLESVRPHDGADDSSDTAAPSLSPSDLITHPSSAETAHLELHESTPLAERLKITASALLDLLDDLIVLDEEDRGQLEECVRWLARGYRLDPHRPHIAARKAVLNDPPRGIGPEGTLRLALALHLSHGRITTGRLDRILGRGFVATLDRNAVHRAQLMAALLRPASAVALHAAGKLTIQRRDQATAVELRLEAASPSTPALTAQRSCDLWHLIAPSRLRFVADGSANRLESLARLLSLPDGTPRPDDIGLPSEPGLERDDLVLEAAWKTFLFHFERMLLHEPGTRAGLDPEELHDMRVATRRMRVASQVFGDHLDTDMLRPHVRGMRRTGRGLGPVRDLDVFWESVEGSRSALSEGADLVPLRTAWERAHGRARTSMLDFLDGARYRRFVERFGEQLHEPWFPAEPAIGRKGEAAIRRLRHVAPALVLERLAAVLAYEEWVLDPHSEVPLRRYHRLRIAIKQVRYTLEYLRELLGEDVRPVVKTIKQVQNHLGELQDAVVGCAFLRDFLTWGELDPDPTVITEPPMQPIVAPGVAELFVHWQRQIGEKIATFPDVWRECITPELQSTVTRLVTEMTTSER